MRQFLILLKKASVIVLLALVFAGICYRIIWPVAPGWLDEIVYGTSIAALLVLLIVVKLK